MLCSIFGHRKIETNINLQELKNVLKNLISERNVDTFYFGGFSEFDDLCHALVTELKSEFPDVKRIFCLSDERHLRIAKRPKWLKDDDYEDFIYLPLSFDWWYQRIYYRNCAMIDDSDFVLFYVTEKENSGAYKAYKYAKSKKKNIINIYEKPNEN